MLCDSDNSLTGNLNASLLAFFDLDDNAQLSKNEFLEHVRQICSQQQCAFLEHIFVTQQVGFLKMGDNKIEFSYGLLYGLRVKDQIVRICKVTSANFDQVFKLAAIASTAQYDKILQMREEVALLQTNLAHITFQIMTADHERFQLLKKRNKQIEIVKRAVRRTERQQI